MFSRMLLSSFTEQRRTHENSIKTTALPSDSAFNVKVSQRRSLFPRNFRVSSLRVSVDAVCLCSIPFMSILSSALPGDSLCCSFEASRSPLQHKHSQVPRPRRSLVHLAAMFLAQNSNLFALESCRPSLSRCHPQLPTSHNRFLLTLTGVVGANWTGTRLPRNSRALGPSYDALNALQRMCDAFTKVWCLLKCREWEEMREKGEMWSVTIFFSTNNRETLWEHWLKHADKMQK